MKVLYPKLLNLSPVVKAWILMLHHSRLLINYLKKKFLQEKAISAYNTYHKYISSGVIKAGFLEQIGLYELAVDELVKENKLRDACVLLKRKSLFSRAIEKPTLCKSHMELLFFHFHSFISTK